MDCLLAKSIKAICLSDLHIGNNRVGDKWKDALRLGYSKAQEYNCPLVVAGDWFDTRSKINVILLNEVVSFFNDEILPKYYFIPLYTVLGNHDISGSECALENSPMYILGEIFRANKAKIFIGSDEIVEIKDPVNGVVFILIGYQNTADLKGCLSEIVIKKEAKDIVLVIHADIYGSSLDGGSLAEFGIEPKALDVGCSFVLNGHIHKPQNIVIPASPRPKTLGAIIGSPYSMKFGDAEGSIGYLIEENGEYRLDREATGLGFKSKEISCEGMDRKNLDKVLKNIDILANTITRLVVPSDDVAYAVDKIQKLGLTDKVIVSPIIKGAKESRITLVGNETADEIIQKYLISLSENDMIVKYGGKEFTIELLSEVGRRTYADSLR